jgi:hypothetical protein
MTFEKYWLAPARHLLARASHDKSHVEIVESLRASYWGPIPRKEPQPTTPRSRLANYVDYIEHAIAALVAQHSLPYWLLANRLAPRANVPPDPVIAYETHLSIESAFYKYAQLQMCDSVGWSDAVDPQDIYDGLAVELTPPTATADLRRHHLPVLTRFGVDDVRVLAKVRALVDELQRTHFRIRSLFWSGRIVPHHLAALDLQYTAEPYRLANGDVRFGPARKEAPVALPHSDQPIHLPHLDILSKQPIAILPDGTRRQLSSPPPFRWIAFSLQQFYRGHRRMAFDFHTRNGCHIQALAAIIGCLSIWRTQQWQQSSEDLVADWQLAFATIPVTSIRPQLWKLIHTVCVNVLGDDDIPEEDFLAALAYLTLAPADRTGIDILCGHMPMPLSVCGDFYLVDLAWIFTFLDRLFFRLQPSGHHCCF